MKKQQLALVLASLVLTLSLGGCSSAPAFAGPFDPVGNWHYTVTDTKGNTYDSGTITFSGQSTNGSWKQDNYYHIEYAGTWTLDGSALSLAGAETWKGVATGSNSLSGTWSKENGDSGTWKATR